MKNSIKFHIFLIISLFLSHNIHGMHEQGDYALEEVDFPIDWNNYQQTNDNNKNIPPVIIMMKETPSAKNLNFFERQEKSYDYTADKACTASQISIATLAASAALNYVVPNIIPTSWMINNAIATGASLGTAACACVTASCCHKIGKHCDTLPSVDKTLKNFVSGKPVFPHNEKPIPLEMNTSIPHSIEHKEGKTIVTIYHSGHASQVLKNRKN